MCRTNAGLTGLLAVLVAGCGGKSGHPGDAVGTGGATTTTGGAPGVAASGGAPGSGGSAAPGGSVGQSGGGAVSSTGGNLGTASGGRSASGGASSGGASAPDAGSTTPDSGAAGAVVYPPVSDPSSTLGISAPGAAYHVEGNIPYGPHVMQRLDVIYPNAAGPRGTTTLPGVIMFHGGGWINNSPTALKASMSSFFSRFLAHGFLVCNVEYRLADGTANGAIAPAAVEDALLAAKWFWDHLDYYHVDKTRYVVTGASAGAHLGMMVGMATPAAALGPTSPTDYRIAAIVNGYGPPDVSDLLALNVSFAVQWLPPETPDRAALALRVSPLTYARRDIPPLITVQGALDTTVPVAENQHLDQVLKAAGADANIHLVAGAGHGFTTPDTAWPDAESAMFGFLVAHGIGR